MRKFCNITDPHFGYAQKKPRIFKRFLKKLGPIDGLLVSGDIATTDISEIELFFKTIREFSKDLKVFIVFGNHDCLDEETELLTKRGWIKHTEIKKEDLVLSIDKNDNSVWSSIDSIIVKPSDSIYKYSNNNLDMAVTENHRIAHYKRQSNQHFSELTYDKIKEIKNRCKIPCAKENINKEVDISDKLLKIMGWILTDGSVNKNGIFIFQSKPKYVDEIEELLKKTNSRYSKYSRERKIESILGKKIKSQLPQNEFRFNQRQDICKTIREYIGDGKNVDKGLFNKLSSRQIRVLLETMVDGDGSWYKGLRNNGVLYGKQEFLDWVQTLAVQAGIRSNLIKYRESDYKLNLTFVKDYIQVDSLHDKAIKEKYEGNVWCLNVPHTNFMVRRNGKAFFTGNCWDRKREYDSLQGLLNDRDELCKKYDIHYLQNNHYEDDTLQIFGYDGWYLLANPNTNDHLHMPQKSGMGELTSSQLMQRREQKAAEYIFNNINPEKQVIVMTHFNPFSTNDKYGSYESMQGNHRIYELLLEEGLDYFIFGHSHQKELEYVKSKDKTCTVFNVGARYEESPNYINLLFKIIEVY